MICGSRVCLRAVGDPGFFNIRFLRSAWNAVSEGK